VSGESLSETALVTPQLFSEHFFVASAVVPNEVNLPFFLNTLREAVFELLDLSFLFRKSLQATVTFGTKSVVLCDSELLLVLCFVVEVE